MSCVLLATFKLVSLLQVARILTSYWIKLRGSHAINGIYVSLYKTSLLSAGKTRNINRFWRLLKVQLLSTFCNIIFFSLQQDILQDRGGKTPRYSTRFAAYFLPVLQFLNLICRPQQAHIFFYSLWMSFVGSLVLTKDASTVSYNIVRCNLN